MRRVLVIVVLVALTGCAVDPWSQLETGSPRLSDGQVAALRKNEQSPDQLGLQVLAGALYGVNEMAGSESVTVPLVKIPTDQPRAAGGSYRVPVILATVNGHRNVRVMLDSGSNQLLLGYSLAQDLRIPTLAGAPSVVSMGIGGAADNYLAVVPELNVGALTIRRLVGLIGPDVQALQFTGFFYGKTPVMIMGVNSLTRLSYLSIDYLGGRVTMSPVASYEPDRSHPVVVSVPLRWENNLPVILVGIDNQPLMPCVLDTGGDYGMLVPRSVASVIGYWQPGKGGLGMSSGVGGASLTTTYNIRQVKVGNTVFEAVPSRTAVAGPEPAGGRVLLGNVVLRRHKVTFDFRRGLLWLER